MHAQTHTCPYQDTHCQSHLDFYWPRQPDRGWITSQSWSPGLMTSACLNMSWRRGELWICLFLLMHVQVKQQSIICPRVCLHFQTSTRLSPSYIEMVCGWRRDDIISISRRICTMSCSSLIFSFRIDLIATWKQRETTFISWIAATLVLCIKCNSLKHISFFSIKLNILMFIQFRRGNDQRKLKKC